MNKTYIMVPVKPVKHDLVSEIDKFIHVPLATYDTYGSVKIGSGLLINSGVLSFNEELIPTELGQLNQDTEHRLVTDAQIEYWDGKVNVSDLNKYYTKSESDSLLNEKTDKTTTNDLTKRVDKNENNIDILTQNKANKSDIIDNLTTNNSNQMLSARQGYRLNNMINDINALLKSDNVNLDTIQEIVNYIENNKDLIDSIMLTKVNISDVIDNLTTTDSTKPLSANQGVILKEFIDALPEWAKQPTKPTYYYSEILERPTQVRVSVTKVGIPTKVSQLENDSNFLTDLELTSKDYATSEDVRNAISDKATTSYVDKKVADLINSAPDTLDTLGELATAIKENKDVIDVLNNAITNKADKSELLYNIIDAENNSLVANDIQTNLIKLNGYIDSSGIWHEITETPILVEDINSLVLVSGYYVIPKSLIENGSFGYALYYFTDNVINRQIKDLIGKNDENSQWLTNTYNYNSGNISAFGSNNLVSGDSSIVAGNNNKNSGYNSLITGKDNTSNAGESVVAGLKNTNLGGSSAVFGCYNNVNDNQGLASGFHNKISTGSLYSTAVGIGNVTKGVSNFVAGAYNYTGGDYDTAIGNSNVVGGSITYNGIDIKDIPTYTSKEYNENDLVKLNGFVYKSLMNINNVTPKPQGTEGYWEIVKPTTTKGSQINSFAGGQYNKVKHSNCFVYGKGLQTSADYQTILGKYNSDYSSADLIVGNGSSDKDRYNSMEVRSSSTATTLNVNTNGNGLKMLQLSKGGTSQLELRASDTAVGTLAAKGGLYIKPYGENNTFSDKYGILMKEKIYPLTNNLIDLGAPTKKFKTLYVTDLNVGGTTFGVTNFVLTSDRNNWNNKVDATYVDNAISSAITTALNTEV